MSDHQESPGFTRGEEASEVVAAHEVTRHLIEVDDYPAHPVRMESARFEHNRAALIGLARGCWVCGATEEIEAHHVFEWAEWDALDPVMVLDTLRAFNPYGLTYDEPQPPITDPDDIRNLLLLCALHHRERETGIHEISWPMWLVQRARRRFS